MQTDRDHVRVLDFMIGETLVEPYRSALIAARNMLDTAERKESAGVRTANDWPYCGACGAAYKPLATTGLYTREVARVCGCSGAVVVWQGRPKGSTEWEYIVPVEQLAAAEASWERFGAILGVK